MALKSVTEFADIFNQLIRSKMAAAGLASDPEKDTQLDGIILDVGRRLGAVMLDLKAAGETHGFPVQDVAHLVESAVTGYVERTIVELVRSTLPQVPSTPMPKREDMN